MFPTKRCMSCRYFEINNKAHFEYGNPLKFKQFFVITFFGLFYDKRYIVEGF